MKPVFVSRGILSPEEVLELVTSRPAMTVKEKRVYNFFQNYVKQCTDNRKCYNIELHETDCITSFF